MVDLSTIREFSSVSQSQPLSSTSSQYQVTSNSSEITTYNNITSHLHGNNYHHPTPPSYHWFEHILLLVCCIGIVGNVLNFFVLTRRRFRTALNNLECSANYGLVALAISDLCYCTVVLPHAIFPGFANFIKNSQNVVIVLYKIYGIGLINLFQMTSTWIIVIIAINRWIVVKYPIKAKRMIDKKVTIYSILIVCVACLVMCLPYFLKSAIRWTPNGHSYIIYNPWSDSMVKYLRIYLRWIWPVLASFIPLFILVWSNINLVIQIRKAMRQDSFNVGRRLSHHKAAESKVTVTLIAIVVMYLIFAIPAEIIRYVNPYAHWGPQVGVLVAKSLNLLQAVNFAFNFLLYCAVNITFRQTVKEMIRPRRRLPSYRTNDDIKTLQTLISQRFTLRSGSSLRSSAVTI